MTSADPADALLPPPPPARGGALKWGLYTCGGLLIAGSVLAGFMGMRAFRAVKDSSAAAGIEAERYVRLNPPGIVDAFGEVSSVTRLDHTVTAAPEITFVVRLAVEGSKGQGIATVEIQMVDGAPRVVRGRTQGPGDRQGGFSH